MPQANSPEEVVQALETIIAKAISEKDTIGYFAALYKNVTLAVIKGIKQGFFEDGPRMAKLDTIFANRYLTAYEQYQSGQLPSRSWLQAFRATTDSDLIILQELLIGMNAHINLDLGIAAARAAPGNQLPGLQTDFNRINDILGKLTPMVRDDLVQLSPKIGDLVKKLPFGGLVLAGFSMSEARDIAWKLAKDLAPLSPTRCKRSTFFLYTV